MKKQLLFLFAALLPLLASAQTQVEIDGIWYNLMSEGKQAEVTYKGDSYNSYDDEYSGSITLPATVTYEGEAYSVTSIGKDAFRDCRSLTAITLPESVTSIGDWAFYRCRSLTAINIPESVTSIGEVAFSGCSSLTAITLPEGVTSILNNAFYGCTNLKVVNIPNGLTRLSDAAFDGCSSLTSIVLPKSVKYIYGKAFANCSELTDVYCYAETLPSTDANAFDGSYVEYATLHVPANALDTYKTTAPWNNFGTIVAIEGEQPDEPTEEGWSEWEALGTAVTIRGKEAMMTSLQYWGEGEIAPWEEPITIDQRYDRADPTKKQLRLNGIFNAKEIVLDYDSSTG